MNTPLFLLYERFTNGYMPSILDIFSILAILSAIFVIMSKNPIVSILCLIGLFASISSYLITLGLIGANHAAEPFILLGQVCTAIYFAHFIIIVPITSILQNTFLDLATKN